LEIKGAKARRVKTAEDEGSPGEKIKPAGKYKARGKWGKKKRGDGGRRRRRRSEVANKGNLASSMLFSYQ